MPSTTSTLASMETYTRLMREAMDRANSLLQALDRNLEAPTEKLMKKFICRDCSAEDPQGKMTCPVCKSKDIEVQMVERSQAQTITYQWIEFPPTNATITYSLPDLDTLDIDMPF